MEGMNENNAQQYVKIITVSPCETHTTGAG